MAILTIALVAVLLIWLENRQQKAAERAASAAASAALDKPEQSEGAHGAPAETPVQSSPQPAEPPLLDRDAETLAEQRDFLLHNLRVGLGLSNETIEQLQAVFSASKWLGQGNPKVTEHPMSRKQCRQIRTEHDVVDRQFSHCEARNMVPIQAGESGDLEVDPTLCIDRYEFPNLACEYPVTWVRAREAAKICNILGKRLCDAHEWEGACAGAVRPVQEEYDFSQPRLQMSYFHNLNREKIWSYGQKKNHSKCATMSKKSDGCVASGWQCGSNTYPAGAFLECVSSFGVYDLHGNVAEHMNLPLKEDQLGSRGGLGETEMKGSWFIFSMYEAHEDDCRWRAPSWHASRVDDPQSHSNYHLGFRCCKDIAPGEPGREEE